MPEEQNSPVVAKQVLNGASNVTNVAHLSDSNIRKHLIDALTVCRDTLLDHCGPYSGFSMIRSLRNLDRYSEFTRDGITIIESVEFSSPLQNIVRDVLVNIGRMVDFRAKDNTTTAMLLVCEFLISQLSEYNNDFFLKSTFHDTRRYYNEAISRLFAEIDDIDHVTYEDMVERLPDVSPNQIAGAIAFTQAMSSTGGNLELAKALREMYINTPRECWDYTSFGGSMHENDQLYYVEYPDADYKLPVASFMDLSTVATDALNTEYHCKSATLMVVSGGIADASEEENQVLNTIQSLEAGESLAIIGSHFTQNILQKAVMHNYSHANRVTLWLYSSPYRVSGQQLDIELSVLSAITRHDVVEPAFLVKNVEVFWKDGYLRLNNIYPEFTEGMDPHVNPYYQRIKQLDKDRGGKDDLAAALSKDPDGVSLFLYNQLYSSILSKITEYKKGHNDDERMYDALTSAMFHLIGVRVPHLRLGGMAHEQLANRSVAQDALGAIMVALTDGAVRHGLWSVYYVGQRYMREYLAELSKVNIVAYTMVIYLFSAIVRILTHLAARPSSEEQVPDDYLENPAHANVLYRGDALGTYDYLRAVATDEAFLDSDQIYGYPVFQSRKGLYEIFRRIADVSMRFAYTRDIIVPNTAVLNDKE